MGCHSHINNIFQLFCHIFYSTKKNQINMRFLGWSWEIRFSPELFSSLFFPPCFPWHQPHCKTESLYFPILDISRLSDCHLPWILDRKRLLRKNICASLPISSSAENCHLLGGSYLRPQSQHILISRLFYCC